MSNKTLAPQSVLVTGANGFVGHVLCTELARRGNKVRAAIRELSRATNVPCEVAVVGNIEADLDWSPVLAGIDTVVHLAARVHVMREKAIEPMSAFRAVNVAATERLVHQAAALGVRRFVYVSSIGVHGNVSTVPLNEMSLLAPDTPYTLSKLEAERRLSEISGRTGIDIVVVRPPLVYGPNNPGNFLRLLRLIQRGIPLPLASVDNRRSMIYVGNLVDALIACAAHPAARGNTYLVSDGEDISTPELIDQLAKLMGRSARLWRVPPVLLRLAGTLTGKSADVDRLIGSLLVDSSRIRAELDWTPPFTVAEGLAQTARWFLDQRGGSPT